MLLFRNHDHRIDAKKIIKLLRMTFSKFYILISLLFLKSKITDALSLNEQGLCECIHSKNENSRPKERVHSGSIVDSNDLRFMGSFYKKTSLNSTDYYQHLCGANLINEDHFLTAAHWYPIEL